MRIHSDSTPGQLVQKQHGGSLPGKADQCNNLAWLPEDLIVNIVNRASLKDAIRFSAMSKSYSAMPGLYEEERTRPFKFLFAMKLPPDLADRHHSAGDLIEPPIRQEILSPTAQENCIRSAVNLDGPERCRQLCKLITLAEHFTPENQRSLFNARQYLENEADKTTHLAHLSLCLKSFPQALQEDLVTAVLHVADETDKRWIMCRTVSSLSTCAPQLRQRLLEATLALQDARSRGLVLCNLTSQMRFFAPYHRQLLLNGALAIQNVPTRSRALSYLGHEAFCLDTSQQDEIINEICKLPLQFRGAEYRAIALNGLAANLKFLSAQQQKLFTSAVKKIEGKSRVDILKHTGYNIHALSPQSQIWYYQACKKLVLADREAACSNLWPILSKLTAKQWNNVHTNLQSALQPSPNLASRILPSLSRPLSYLRQPLATSSKPS